MQPVIKWTGSKRSQAPYIISMFPKYIDTYYEPFVGSGAVLFELLTAVEKGDVRCGKFVCSDINEDLIETWKLVKNEPEILMSEYEKLYNEFSVLDIQGKKDYYKEKQKKFNSLKTKGIKGDWLSCVFFWMRRTAYNGLVRYNRKGEFNAPCHFTRNGIEPAKLKPIMDEWSRMLNKYDVEFICRSYSDIEGLKDTDFCYLDPPYANTVGMYGDDFDDDKFRQWLVNVPHFAFSYNGKHNENDGTQDMTGIDFRDHVYLHSGNSSFSRLKTQQIDVLESLYIK